MYYLMPARAQKWWKRMARVFGNSLSFFLCVLTLVMLGVGGIVVCVILSERSSELNTTGWIEATAYLTEKPEVDEVCRPRRWVNCDEPDQRSYRLEFKVCNVTVVEDGEVFTLVQDCENPKLAYYGPSSGHDLSLGESDQLLDEYSALVGQNVSCRVKPDWRSAGDEATVAIGANVEDESTELAYLFAVVVTVLFFVAAAIAVALVPVFRRRRERLEAEALAAALADGGLGSNANNSKKRRRKRALLCEHVRKHCSVPLVEEDEEIAEGEHVAAARVDDECAICLDELGCAPVDEEKGEETGDEKCLHAARIPCGHVFHTSCIVTWIERGHGKKCPLCNYRLSQMLPNSSRNATATDDEKLASMPGESTAHPPPLDPNAINDSERAARAAASSTNQNDHLV